MIEMSPERQAEWDKISFFLNLTDAIWMDDYFRIIFPDLTKLLIVPDWSMVSDHPFAAIILKPSQISEAGIPITSRFMFTTLDQLAPHIQKMREKYGN